MGVYHERLNAFVGQDLVFSNLSSTWGDTGNSSNLTISHKQNGSIISGMEWIFGRRINSRKRRRSKSCGNRWSLVTPVAVPSELIVTISDEKIPGIFWVRFAIGGNVCLLHNWQNMETMWKWREEGRVKPEKRVRLTEVPFFRNLPLLKRSNFSWWHRSISCRSPTY